MRLVYETALILVNNIQFPRAVRSVGWSLLSSDRGMCTKRGNATNMRYHFKELHKQWSPNESSFL